MNISVEYVAEPKLQFGHYFEHEDTKTGLAEFGPFGKNVEGLHPSEVKLGFIGTRETISGAREWIEECSSPIESENVKVIREMAKSEEDPALFGPSQVEDHSFERVYKILNRDFVGFSRASQWECSFQVNERWDRALNPKDVDAVLAVPDKQKRIWQLVDLFDEEMKGLAEISPKPDIIILALTQPMVDEADTERVSGNFFLNLRRALKARAMCRDIPVQLIQRGTVLGKNSPGTRLQEKATRAWNFCTAQYYKADGIPWRPKTFRQDVCFIGISFYVAHEIQGRLTMRSCVAQAFDYLGQGLVLRGDPFEWDEERQGRSPHLTKEGARKMIHDTLQEYVKVSGRPPRRIVIHKTSRFWGSDHGEHNELDGFYEGIEEVFPRCETDLVTLGQTGIRLFREGMYPPVRGTYFSLEGQRHFLYTLGFVPYFETYPGSFVPEPWEIVEHHGGTAPKDLLREVLELTKMNVNNCSFADGTPITLSFSHKVGEIMKHVPEGQLIKTSYKFYM